MVCNKYPWPMPEPTCCTGCAGGVLYASIVLEVRDSSIGPGGAGSFGCRRLSSKKRIIRADRPVDDAFQKQPIHTCVFSLRSGLLVSTRPLSTDAVVVGCAFLAQVDGKDDGQQCADAAVATAVEAGVLEFGSHQMLEQRSTLVPCHLFPATHHQFGLNGRQTLLLFMGGVCRRSALGLLSPSSLLRCAAAPVCSPRWGASSAGMWL